MLLPLSEMELAANMLSQSLTLIADVGDSHNLPKGSAGQGSDGEDPRGGLSRRINESAFVGGIEAYAQGVDPGKPVVEQAAQHGIARVMRDRIDARAFHDTDGFH